MPLAPTPDQLPQQPRLLDQVRNVLRTKHYSTSTEKTYVYWIRHYILFHNKQHPDTLNESHINTYLSHLAVKEHVSASTQNQALCAIVFLYKQVLHRELGDFGELVWAKKPKRIPVVFSRQEVSAILNQLQGIYRIMAVLLYGSGLRLMECLQLRIKDIDFEYNQISIRDAKGAKDRIVPLPQSMKDSLKAHLDQVRQLHEKDLKNGYGNVYLPDALEKKYPKASYNWGWQFVFPAHQISTDPISGVRRRHHLYSTVLQKAVKMAIQKSGNL